MVEKSGPKSNNKSARFSTSFIRIGLPNSHIENIRRTTSVPIYSILPSKLVRTDGFLIPEKQAYPLPSVMEVFPPQPQNLQPFNNSESSEKDGSFQTHCGSWLDKWVYPSSGPAFL